MLRFFWIMAVVLLVAGCDDKEQIEEAVDINDTNMTGFADVNTTQKKVKKLEFKDISGRTYEIEFNDDSIYIRGNTLPLVLNVFDLSSYDSVNQIPNIINLHKYYKKYVNFFAISAIPKSKEIISLEDFMELNKIDFPVFKEKDNKDILIGIGQQDKMPITVIYDDEGEEKERFNGAVLEEMINVDLVKLLKEINPRFEEEMKK